MLYSALFLSWMTGRALATDPDPVVFRPSLNQLENNQLYPSGVADVYSQFESGSLLQATYDAPEQDNSQAEESITYDNHAVETYSKNSKNNGNGHAYAYAYAYGHDSRSSGNTWGAPRRERPEARGGQAYASGRGIAHANAYGQDRGYTVGFDYESAGAVVPKRAERSERTWGAKQTQRPERPERTWGAKQTQRPDRPERPARPERTWGSKQTQRRNRPERTWGAKPQERPQPRQQSWGQPQQRGNAYAYAYAYGHDRASWGARGGVAHAYGRDRATWMSQKAEKEVYGDAHSEESDHADMESYDTATTTEAAAPEHTYEAEATEAAAPEHTYEAEATEAAAPEVSYDHSEMEGGAVENGDDKEDDDSSMEYNVVGSKNYLKQVLWPKNP